MISAMTAPGTRLVCVQRDGLNMLVEGQTYILSEILLLDVMAGFIVLPVAQVHGVKCTCGGHLANFQLGHFDIAQLPKVLTELLETTKVPELVK